MVQSFTDDPRSSEEFDRVLRVQTDDGLLGGGGLDDAVAEAAGLVLADLRVHAHDPDLVDALDGILDFGLGRAGVDLEGVELELVHPEGALLGEQRALDDVDGVDVGWHQATSAFLPIGLIFAILPVWLVGPLSQPSSSALPITTKR